MIDYISNNSSPNSDWWQLLMTGISINLVKLESYRLPWERERERREVMYPSPSLPWDILDPKELISYHLRGLLPISSDVGNLPFTIGKDSVLDPTLRVVNPNLLDWILSWFGNNFYFINCFSSHGATWSQEQGHFKENIKLKTSLFFRYVGNKQTNKKHSLHLGNKWIRLLTSTPFRLIAILVFKKELKDVEALRGSQWKLSYQIIKYKCTAE